MDARIAIITGTVFAGVLVAGALAAPRGGGEPNANIDAAAGVSAVDGTVELIDQSSNRYNDDDDEDDDHDDDRYDRRHDDDDDEHEDDD